MELMAVAVEQDLLVAATRVALELLLQLLVQVLLLQAVAAADKAIKMAVEE
jgi:hypothetical protein